MIMKNKVSKRMIAVATAIMLVTCFIFNQYMVRRANANVSNVNAAAEGWMITNGRWWYQFSDGSYAKSEYIDGYWLDGSLEWFMEVL